MPLIISAVMGCQSIDSSAHSNLPQQGKTVVVTMVTMINGQDIYLPCIIWPNPSSGKIIPAEGKVYFVEGKLSKKDEWFIEVIRIIHLADSPEFEPFSPRITGTALVSKIELAHEKVTFQSALYASGN